MNEILLAQIQMQLGQIETRLVVLLTLNGKMDNLLTRLEALEHKMLMVNIVNATQGAQLAQVQAGSDNTQSGVNAQGAATVESGKDISGRDKVEVSE